MQFIYFVMLTDVIIVYDKENQIEELKKVSLKDSPSFTFINDLKKAFQLKHHWGAKLSPFILCLDKETPIKAFYSESGEDPIKSLIKFLKS